MKHDAQGPDETATPRHRIWMVVAGSLRLTGWEAPTNEADDPEQRSWKSFLSILVPLNLSWTIKGRVIHLEK
jgi:hypothetical protein